jgi:Protein of unknown function (DUF2793)
VTTALQSPPPAASEGQCYIVPEGAVDDWQARARQIALCSNGGWMFLAPRAGWRVWDASRGAHLLFDGADWVPDAMATSPTGAGLICRVLEFDHVLIPGPSNTTAEQIPANAQVLGVSGRVLDAITGAGLTSWKLGVPGSVDRYGSGLGLPTNSYALGLSGTPVTYFSATPLLVSADGGDFAGGLLRLAISYWSIVPPRAV